ncbi:MAG: acyl-CoA thioesterase [Planctomycetota bacterium]|jgi:acyl-CoA thioester hydrolase
MNRLADWPVTISLPIQWGDQDALSHVNNVTFFRWWESARIAYSVKIGLIRENQVADAGTVLVSIKCDFRQQLTFPDTVHIGSRLKRVGNSSFEVEHLLISNMQPEICAEAVSTMVYFDFATQSPCRIPEEVRESMRALESGRTVGGLDG